MNYLKYVFYLILCVMSQEVAVAQNDDPLLSLPWAVGDTWWVHHGVHDNMGDGRSPIWSAIDLAPGPNASTEVLAARGGTVIDHCAAKVVIDHGDGWYTGYYHLDQPLVNEGDVVYRGQVLGNASTNSSCGGGASSDHVHFTVRYDPTNNGNFNNFIDLVDNDIVIGGWKFWKVDSNGNGENDSTDIRLGGLRRDGFMIDRPDAFRYYHPSSAIYNDGMIGNISCKYDLAITKDIRTGNTFSIRAANEIELNASIEKGAKLKLFAGKFIRIKSGNSLYNNAIMRVKTSSCQPYYDLSQGRMQQVSNKLNKVDEVKPSLNSGDFIVQPNPFSEQVTISFTLENSQNLNLVITDLSGKRVNHLIKDKVLTKGVHNVVWDGKSNIGGFLPQGIYLCQLITDNHVETKRIFFLSR